MICDETIELFTLKDKFGKVRYLILNHVVPEAYIVEPSDHYDSMMSITAIIKFMNCFKLYGNRDYTTLDVSLGISDYSAINSAKRRYLDYNEIQKGRHNGSM